MLEVIKHPAFIWSVVGLVGSGLLLWILSYFVASYYVYTKTLSRDSKDKWTRDVPSELAPDSVKMYEIGVQWGKESAYAKKDVHIVNKGLNLYGEYYDFGSDTLAVILSGRTEALVYGYYFAIPYAKNGCNVLVLDPRAHGLSDGKFNTVGFEESGDVIAWMKYIVKGFGVKKIIFHGICIGAATGMLAITNPECPKEVQAMVTEGMFVNFGESMKNHLKELKKPVFGVYGLVRAWMRKYTGHDMIYGPIDVIDKLDKPILMLQSKEDLYSTPENAVKLYEKAGSQDKELVWFEHGKHSMLRITDTERYDSSIAQFLNRIK